MREAGQASTGEAVSPSGDAAHAARADGARAYRPGGSLTAIPLRRWAWIAVALAALVYLPSLLNGFAYDDRHIIVQNETIHSLSTLGEVWSTPYWPGEEGATFGLWRPLTSTTMGLAWMLGGGAAWPFHLLNLLLHAGASGLLVVALGRVMPAVGAGVAGVAFALHPVHVEAVANGVGLSELMAAVLVLGALLMAGSAAAPGPRLGRTVATLALYLAACLAKEGAIVFPALLGVWDAARDGLRVRDLPAYLRSRGPLMVALALLGVVVLLARREVLGAVADPFPPLGAELLDEIPRAPTVGIIWAHVLRLILWPASLSPDYTPGVIPVTTIWTPLGMMGAVGVVSLFVAALVLWRRRDTVASRWSPLARTLPAGLLWFALAFLPVTNLLFVAGLMLGERTLYLPSAGAAAILGALIAGVLQEDGASLRSGPGRWLVPVLAGAAALWGLRTVTYIPAWKDDVTIFAHMMATAPQSARSHWARGDLALQAGREAEAVAAYARATTWLGDEYSFLTNTAQRLMGRERGDLARVFALRGTQEEPQRAEAWQILTIVAAGEARWRETAEYARETLARRPGDRVALHLGSTAHGELGEFAQARDLRAELAGRPDAAWQDWFWLAGLRKETGDLPGAIAAAQEARGRAPEAAHPAVDSLLATLEPPRAPGNLR